MQVELLPQQHVDVSQAAIKKIVDNIETVIIGKRESVELVVLAFIAKGHVLLEDLPGTGKTTLVSSMAKSVDCKFRRIQFTPDIMPSDVSGFSIFNQKTRDFEFRPGGVMSNLVLADEINRASAKTQAALLEAMEERQVTVDSNTYPLEEPFMVLATQNPIEQFGTYPLPEAQVDRFLIKLSMGYPAFEQEVEVIAKGNSAKKAISPVVSSEDIMALRSLAEQVHVSPMVIRYIVEIVTGTRNSPEVQVGSSPRGGIALTALSRAYALLQGRNYVLPDDVKYLAPFVLGHRISLSHEAKVQGRDEKDVIKSIISSIAVPYEDDEPIAVQADASMQKAPVTADPVTAPSQVAAIDPQITQPIGVQDSVQRSYRTTAQEKTPTDDAPLVEPKDDSHIFEQFENSRMDQSSLPAVSPLQQTAELPNVSRVRDDSSEQPGASAQQPAVSAEPRSISEKALDPIAEREHPKRTSDMATAPMPANDIAKQAKARATAPMPSNDIAEQARARANEKRPLFGRKRKTDESPSVTVTAVEPTESRKPDTEIRVEDNVRIHEISENEERRATARKSESARAVETAEPARESRLENTVSNESKIPSTPDEVDVQAAFDAAFANLSFATDDDA